MRRFLAVVLLLSAPAAADVIDSRQKDLERVKKEISRKREEKRKTETRAQELEREVGRISGELRSSQRSLKDVEKRIRETERRRAEAEDRLWAARLDVKQWNRTLSEDLRRFYERCAVGRDARFWELTLRRRLVNDKVSAMSDAVAKHSEFKELHAELAAAKADFERLHDERAQEADRVREAKSGMTRLLATVQGRRAVLENEIEELKASAHRFEKLIQDLIREREAREAREAAARAKAEAAAGKKKARVKSRKKTPSLADFGKLPWPVTGAVVGRFGKFKHPELDTFVVSNGVTIRPEAHAPVRAVAKGEVLYAGEFMGYGLMALVAHPDSLFTIYAHLGELKVKKGQKVSVGEILGTAGSDAQDRPMVYFELRLHGEAMDPLLWLE
jgi:septal ring factor EnvC (AmiA/AmiB activator)